MFTGLIEEIGVIQRIVSESHGRRFSIEAQRILEDLKPEDSIAVNGVCLTVTKVENRQFEVTAVEETLNKSTLQSIKTGSKVNLERALRLGDRLGGHIVQGHIDGVAKLITMEHQGESRLIKLEIPENLCKYAVAKGSIAIDGVSLTIASVLNSKITVAIIPYTWQNTTLGSVKIGQKINIEMDFFGKYIEKLFEQRAPKSKMSGDWLRSLGY
jgi:riboflavin synthase